MAKIVVKTFDKPQMVRFMVNSTGEILYGIGLGDKIICACCGSIFALDEITIDGFLYWVDISETIQEGRMC